MYYALLSLTHYAVFSDMDADQNVNKTIDFDDKIVNTRCPG